jgi:hypothetical protein
VQSFILLDRVNSSDQRPPSSSGLVVLPVGCAFRSLVNQFDRSFRSQILHEPHSPKPALARDSIIMETRVALDHFELDPETANGFI